jgi:hypothetical protein
LKNARSEVARPGNPPSPWPAALDFGRGGTRLPFPALMTVRPLSVLLPLALSLFASSCTMTARTSKDTVGIVGRGIVNSPTNKTLRFDIIRFALKQFCSELLLTGAPIRLSDDQPVIGRYYADSCEAKSLDEPGRSTVIAQFSGQGFAYNAATGRLGFRASGLIEVAPDFRIHESALYVYFRPVQVDTSGFSLLMTEKTLARAALEAAGINEADVGKQIINAQLGRGFTVVRYDADGHTDFALGLIAPGERPFRPFSVEASPRLTVANGRTELFPDQQDFIGKIRLERGEKLTMTLRLEGAPGVDVALLDAKTGAEVISAYVSQKGPQKLRGASFQAILGDGAKMRATADPGPGEYFLALDHSELVGAAQTSKNALPARVDYLLQVGDE